MNLVWFLYMTVAGVSLTSPDPMLLVRFGALYGPLVYQGDLWRLLSCQFVHIGFMHIGFNMYVLYAIGRDLENIYGRVAFLLIYLFAGTFGALASLWAHPISLSAGASGAIFGLAGATLSFYLRLREPLLKNLFLRWRNSLLLFVIYNGIFGLIIPGIDNYAHFGGLAGGFIMGYIISSPEGSDSERHIRTTVGIVVGAVFLYSMAKLLGLPI
jgi:rhomboid protease GluP